MRLDKRLKCSFCNKSTEDVRKLIAGPKVYICDECIDICNEILKEEGGEPAPPSTRQPGDRGKLGPVRWFVALLVVESRLPDSGSKVLVDLQYRLLAAADPEAAYEAALEIGRREKFNYPNAEGEMVRWSFVGLRDLVELDTSHLLHGTELYSDLVRAEPDKLTVPKERLSVFWTEANKNKTARELLEDE